MNIINHKNNNIDLGYNSSKDTIGIVFKTQEEFDGVPKLGVIIPKFMLGYEFNDGDKATEKSININSLNSKCMNDDGGKYWDTKATIKNYITVYPYLNQNQDMAKYTKGDKVIITMIDDDIKTLAFMPYSINRLGQRATDVLRIIVPSNPKEGTELTEENSYLVRLDSTKDVQAITIQTADKNGEMCVHTIKLDSKNGLLTISDNQDRSITLDTQNDSITTKTSGTTIESKGDQVNITCDTMNVEAESKIYFKTDKLEIEADSIKETSSTTEIEADDYKQTSSSGKWEVDSEKHEGMTTEYKEDIFWSGASTNSFNGMTTFPNFQIGAVPSANSVVSPTNGSSAPQGTMLLQTSAAGMPLALFQPLVQALMQIGAASDSYPSGGGQGVKAAADFAKAGFTKKILGE